MKAKKIGTSFNKILANPYLKGLARKVMVNDINRHLYIYRNTGRKKN